MKVVADHDISQLEVNFLRAAIHAKPGSVFCAAAFTVTI